MFSSPHGSTGQQSLLRSARSGSADWRRTLLQTQHPSAAGGKYDQCYAPLAYGGTMPYSPGLGWQSFCTTPWLSSRGLRLLQPHCLGATRQTRTWYARLCSSSGKFPQKAAWGYHLRNPDGEPKRQRMCKGLWLCGPLTNTRWGIGLCPSSPELVASRNSNMPIHCFQHTNSWKDLIVVPAGHRHLKPTYTRSPLLGILPPATFRHRGAKNETNRMCKRAAAGLAKRGFDSNLIHCQMGFG